MTTVSVIANLALDENMLEGIDVFLTDCERYGVPDSAELLDGGHVRVAGSQGDAVGPVSKGADSATVGAVREFVERAREAGFADDTELSYGHDLSVDLTVAAIEGCSCGDHVPATTPGPLNLLVIVHEGCANHSEPASK